MRGHCGEDAAATGLFHSLGANGHVARQQLGLRAPATLSRPGHCRMIVGYDYTRREHAFRCEEKKWLMRSWCELRTIKRRVLAFERSCSRSGKTADAVQRLPNACESGYDGYRLVAAWRPEEAREGTV